MTYRMKRISCVNFQVDDDLVIGKGEQMLTIKPDGTITSPSGVSFNIFDIEAKLARIEAHCYASGMPKIEKIIKAQQEVLPAVRDIRKRVNINITR